MNKCRRLRQLIEGDRIVVVPGAYDALSARMVELCGFEAIEATGAGMSCVLGYPDVGLVTMTEVVGQLQRMAAVTSIPIIADADTGYGNAVNVYRTVREFEGAGVAGLHLEDQVFPKKCGLMSGKLVVSIGEMVGKIKAAVDARRSEDFVVIARTDARETRGLAEVIDRGNAFREAGADMVLVYGLESEDELRATARDIHAPLMTHVSIGAKFASRNAAELEQMGFRVVIYALSPLEAAAKALNSYLEQLRREGSDEPYRSRMMNYHELYEKVGLSEMLELDRRYVRS